MLTVLEYRFVWIVVQSLTIFVWFLAVLCIFALIYIVRNRARYAHIPGPPLKRFLTGNMTEWSAKQENRHDLLIEWGRQYGPVYKFQAFHMVLVFVTSPQLAREVLAYNNYPKAELIYKRLGSIFGTRFLGNGFVSELNQKKWRQRRKSINPAFHKTFLAGDLNIAFNEVSAHVVRQIRDQIGCEESPPIVRLAEVFHDATFQAIAHIAFSLEYSKKKSKIASQAFSTILEAMTPFRQDPTFPYMPWNREFVRDSRQAGCMFRQMCTKHLEQRIWAIEADWKDVPNDILTMMVKGWLALPAVKRATREEIVDDMCTLFIAGQETTANALGFLFLLLEKHPAVKRRLVEEVDQVLDGKQMVVDAEALNKLKLTEAAIKETLRLYPIAPLAMREAKVETKMAGYVLPRQTIICVSYYPIQRLHVPLGDEFIPERFLDANHPYAPPPFSFLPFSVGQRSCLGRQFALQEAKIIAAQLLRNFEIDILPHDSEIKTVERSVIAPKSPIRSLLRLRQHAAPFSEQ